MKTEVLNDIKKTETEYQSMISAAQEEKKKRHAQAELEADNLIAKAQSNAEQYRKTETGRSTAPGSTKARRNPKRRQSAFSGIEGEGQK